MRFEYATKFTLSYSTWKEELKRKVKDRTKNYVVIINLVLLRINMPLTTEKVSLMKPKGRIKLEIKRTTCEKRKECRKRYNFFA